MKLPRNPPIERSNQVQEHVVPVEENEFESDLEDLLVSILDEMTVIKKMIAQQQHRTEDKDEETTKPAAEVEQILPPREQRPNALDFSECF